MSKVDPYSITDTLDAAALGSMTTRLEARGRNPFFRRMLDDYLDALGPGRLSRVLEVGCGTGVATRALAQHPKFSGHIDASDLSAEMVETAKRLAGDAGCADKIAFSVGDALETSGAGEPYDAVIAHTVISHVPDYNTFLSAVARSVASDGQVAIFDGDYASITLGSEKPEDGDAFAGAIINGIITNPTIMRQLPWLASDAGLEVATSFSYLLSEIGTAQFFADMFPSLPVLLPKSGVAAQATVQAWVDQQMKFSEANRFFGAINFYTYLLRPMRPS
jgi:ubiquinone/menaquinone biosynthesis C-methylase UbiE